MAIVDDSAPVFIAFGYCRNVFFVCLSYVDCNASVFFTTKCISFSHDEFDDEIRRESPIYGASM